MERLGAMSGGARIDYSVAGAPTNPTLLFINSIATTRELWARQVSRCTKSFRVITYDARGHGFSQATVGDYRIEQLARDALAILDDVGAESAHVCGISLGGITASDGVRSSSASRSPDSRTSVHIRSSFASRFRKG